jgi:hypothetical protein
MSQIRFATRRNQEIRNMRYLGGFRLLSDHNLPPKKPSDRVQMDAGQSVLSAAQEEVSSLRLPDVKLLGSIEV